MLGLVLGLMLGTPPPFQEFMLGLLEAPRPGRQPRSASAELAVLARDGYEYKSSKELC